MPRVRSKEKKIESKANKRKRRRDLNLSKLCDTRGGAVGIEPSTRQEQPRSRASK